MGMKSWLLSGGAGVQGGGMMKKGRQQSGKVRFPGRGVVGALFKVRKMSYYWIGVDDVDGGLAVRWGREETGAGKTGVTHPVGYAYQHGIVVGGEKGEAEKWYKKAAENGN